MSTDARIQLAGSDDPIIIDAEAEAEGRRLAAVARQHARGKLTARERMELFFDPGTFIETDALARRRPTQWDERAVLPGDAVITGHGKVDGRTVCAYAQDFTILGGSVGEVVGRKVCKLMDLAIEIGCPIVALNDSGGARIQEGVLSLAHYAEMARRTVYASGMVPQVSMVLGPCAGGAAYISALTDFTVVADQTGQMFVTGPDVVFQATGQMCTHEELGGARTNVEVSGNAHYVARDDRDAVAWVQELLSYLPANCNVMAPSYAPTEASRVTARDLELDSLVPDSPRQGYDMHRVIERILDDGEMLEIQEGFGRSIITGLGRIDGHSVGIVASQPMFDAGTLNIDASEKAAKMVRFCDAFNIPVLTLVDTPGYMPGIDQERQGIIRRGAKLLHAYAEATVPTVTVVVRKAYGGAYAAMGSKHLGIDINFTWPTGEIAVMGAEAAVRVLHARRIEAAESPAAAEAMRSQLVDAYREEYANPVAAAEHGFVDEIIEPHMTRLRVAAAFERLRTKTPTLPHKKHGLVPL